MNKTIKLINDLFFAVLVRFISHIFLFMNPNRMNRCFHHLLWFLPAIHAPNSIASRVFAPAVDFDRRVDPFSAVSPSSADLARVLVSLRLPWWIHIQIQIQKNVKCHFWPFEIEYEMKNLLVIAHNNKWKPFIECNSGETDRFLRHYLLHAYWPIFIDIYIKHKDFAVRG